MSLPKLPPLGGLPPLPALPFSLSSVPPSPKAPTCEVCGKPSTRFIQGISDRKLLCDSCELSETSDGRWFRPLQLPTAPQYDNPPARVLACDWPWNFDDATPHKGASDHYKTMTLEDAHKFPLPPIADDAVLFFWRVGGGNDKGSLGEAAYGVMRSWGFTPKSEGCWIKTLPCKACGGKGWAPIKHPSDAIREACVELRIYCDACKGRGHKIALGMGRYLRGSHEIFLIGTRGKGMIPEDKGQRSVFFAPRREHSSKPDRFYQLVEKLYPQGPYVELFARRRRPGWYQYGDELPPEGGV